MKRRPLELVQPGLLHITLAVTDDLGDLAFNLPEFDLEWTLLDANTLLPCSECVLSPAIASLNVSQGTFFKFQLDLKAIASFKERRVVLCVKAQRRELAAPNLDDTQIALLEFLGGTSHVAMTDLEGQTAFILGVQSDVFVISRSGTSDRKVICTTSQYQLGFQGPTVTISEQPDLTLGAHLWQCALILAFRLFHSPQLFPTIDPETDIIELGAGCGLVSFVSSHLLTNAHIWITDTEEVLQVSTLPNFQLFSATFPKQAQRISVIPLQWSRSPNLSFLKDGRKSVTVFASDVLYNTSSHLIFLSTLSAIFKAYKSKAQAFIAYKKRTEGDDAFFDIATERGMNVEQVKILSLDQVEIWHLYP